MIRPGGRSHVGADLTSETLQPGLTQHVGASLLLPREFYLAKQGVVDMLGPSEYEPDFNRGRFHFLIKTALGATHGRPAGKFYANDLEIAHWIVDLKTQIERVREIVQNVE